MSEVNENHPSDPVMSPSSDVRLADVMAAPAPDAAPDTAPDAAPDVAPDAPEAPRKKPEEEVDPELAAPAPEASRPEEGPAQGTREMDPRVAAAMEQHRKNQQQAAPSGHGGQFGNPFAPLARGVGHLFTMTQKQVHQYRERHATQQLRTAQDAVRDYAAAVNHVLDSPDARAIQKDLQLDHLGRQDLMKNPGFLEALRANRFSSADLQQRSESLGTLQDAALTGYQKAVDAARRTGDKDRVVAVGKDFEAKQDTLETLTQVAAAAKDDPQMMEKLRERIAEIARIVAKVIGDLLSRFKNG